jgi:hypothetical protein
MITCFSILKNKILKTLVFSSFYFISVFSFSQTSVNDITIPPEKGFRCRAEIVDGDTIPVVDLYTVDIVTDFVFRNYRTYELWTRTKYNVKVVYPYAILAAAKLKEYDRVLAKIKDEKTKKAYLKLCEKDLRNEFEDELKSLTVSQGKVLMKLIDRETGKTTYEIVKQMRGSFQACFWQALASLFGNSMKVSYNTEEDMMIEKAVKLVEAGQF